MRQRIGRAGMVALAVLMTATAGCLVGRQQSVTESGGRVATGKLAGLQEGTTTIDEVVRAFGAPEQRVKFDDGREVLTYVHERTVSSHMEVIFLLGWSSTKRRITRYSFEFKDGLLSHQWTEDVL